MTPKEWLMHKYAAGRRFFRQFSWNSERNALSLQTISKGKNMSIRNLSFLALSPTASIGQERCPCILYIRNIG